VPFFFAVIALRDENQAGSWLIKVNQTKSNQIKPVMGKYLWHRELHGSGMGFGGVKDCDYDYG
jgi:hypothetical protein